MTQRVEFLSGAAELSEPEWRELDTAYDPFVGRAFLAAAETTGAAGPELAWRPMHLSLRAGDGCLQAMLPLYLRHHAFGDFSHDWHWGTAVHCPGLYFELCYYQGIEYAISQGLQRFEPGEGGEHKLTRGFEPVSTWSAIWVVDKRMRRLLAREIEQEDGAVLDYQAELARHLPYKAGG